MFTRMTFIAAILFAGAATAETEQVSVLDAPCSIVFFDSDARSVLSEDTLMQMETIADTLNAVLPEDVMDHIGGNVDDRCEATPDITLGELLQELVLETYDR